MEPIYLDRRAMFKGLAALMAMTFAMPSARGQPAAVRVRPNVASSAGEDMLEFYAAAVEEMRSRPASEPTSWWFHAAIHSLPQLAASGDDPAWGTRELANLEAIFTPASADPVIVARLKFLRDLALGTPILGGSERWITCPHHTAGRTFLAWHRLYLVLFERTVEAVALEIGALGSNATFALPYWNYLVDPALPDAFLDEESALFNPLRRSEANAGEDIIDALALAGIGTPFPGGWPVASTSTSLLSGGGFSDVLESAPHDTVHGRVGGWMGGVARAARDPIFWLHHAQIDRLCESWRLATPSADPTSATTAGGDWLVAPLRLVDPDGLPVDLTASDVLATDALLYEYDELEPVVASIIAATFPMTPGEPGPGGPGGDEIAAAPGPVQVGGAIVRVPLAPGEAAEAAEAGPPPEQVVLRLVGIKADEEPQIDYDIFVERRDAEGEPSGSPLGRFNLFGRIHLDPAHGAAPQANEGMTVEIDITQSLEEAGLAGVAPSDLVVTIQPNGLPDAWVTIERIELIGR